MTYPLPVPDPFAPPAQQPPQAPSLVVPAPGWSQPQGPRYDQPDQRATAPDPDPEPPQDDNRRSTGRDGGRAASSTPGSIDLISLAARRRTAERLVGKILQSASGLTHAALKQHPDDETWLADEDDIANVAEPLARIIARRIPLPTGDSSASDIVDAVEAGVGILSYLLTNVQESSRVRRSLATGPVFQGNRNDSAEPAPVEQAPAPAPAPDAFPQETWDEHNRLIALSQGVWHAPPGFPT